MSIKAKYIFLLIIFSLSWINSFLNFLFTFLKYKAEDIYIDAIERTWENHPIIDISLTKGPDYKEIVLMDLKDIDYFCDCTHIDEFELLYNNTRCSKYQLKVGCNEYSPLNKASKLNGTTLYVSYSDADYLTLFNRIRDDKSYNKEQYCKDGYKICGYIDIFNNIFCSREEYDCPINRITFTYKNGTFSNITTERNRDSKIINQLIISEIGDANIFDINKFSPYYEIKANTFNKENRNEYFRLSAIKMGNTLKKSDFFEDNKLMEGKAPNSFNYQNLYLYHLIYPGMSFDYPLKFLSLVKQPFRSLIQSVPLVCKLVFIFLLIKFREEKMNKIVLFPNILVIIIYLAYIVTNILFITGKFRLLKNLQLYKDKIDSSYDEYSAGSILAKDIILNVILEFVIFIIYLVFTIKNNKLKNNALINNDEECNNLINNQ